MEKKFDIASSSNQRGPLACNTLRKESHFKQTSSDVRIGGTFLI
jgi:hypothetical protein